MAVLDVERKEQEERKIKEKVRLEEQERDKVRRELQRKRSLDEEWNAFLKAKRRHL